MASQFVCPNCGSIKIEKEQGEDEYFCADCRFKLRGTTGSV
jgi:predicted RNA-binding Zn-ribbon protein involved in translation (DUF1610 family)